MSDFYKLPATTFCRRIKLKSDDRDTSRKHLFFLGPAILPEKICLQLSIFSKVSTKKHLFSNLFLCYDDGNLLKLIKFQKFASAEKMEIKVGEKEFKIKDSTQKGFSNLLALGEIGSK